MGKKKRSAGGTKSDGPEAMRPSDAPLQPDEGDGKSPSAAPPPAIFTVAAGEEPGAAVLAALSRLPEAGALRPRERSASFFSELGAERTMPGLAPPPPIAPAIIPATPPAAPSAKK